MKTYWRVEVELHAFLTSALDGGEWSTSRPGRRTPRETASGTHWIGGWVGPRAVLESMVKRKIPRPHRELNPRTPIVQPVAQRYTDWGITALNSYSYLHIVYNSTESVSFIYLTIISRFRITINANPEWLPSFWYRSIHPMVVRGLHKDVYSIKLTITSTNNCNNGITYSISVFLISTILSWNVEKYSAINTLTITTRSNIKPTFYKYFIP
jgi:hypothetical protein